MLLTVWAKQMILTYFVSERILTFKTVQCTLAFPESFGQFIAFVYQHLSALQKKNPTDQTAKQCSVSVAKDRNEKQIISVLH